ncbi:MAG: hypothetical protein Kow006_03280 [Gammaproteobacteria bacterium]
MGYLRFPRLRQRLENTLFVALLLAAVALTGWLSTRYGFVSDWTAAGRNSLSEASQRLLATLDKPISITAFASPDEVLRRRIRNLVERYQRAGSDVQLEVVNPDTAPQRVRDLDINVDGTLVVSYQGRSEKLTELGEEALTNALLRLARDEDRWVVFLEGHGERSPKGVANHDLQLMARALERQGVKVQSARLAGAIPDNTSVLVIAAPQADLLPGEVQRLVEYLEGGGNLLWLLDPEPLHGLEPLADLLGVSLLPGVVVDATARLYGIQQPDFALVTEYPRHALTRGLKAVTLFPRAAAVDLDPPAAWTRTPILQTSPSTWNETGPLVGEIHADPNRAERAGPLTLGWALQRPRSDSENREQRVVVVGDGDFLANAYLGNGGNRNLGLAIFNWLSHDDRFIAIPARTSPDRSLQLSRGAAVAIGAGFLALLPLLLIGTGVLIWFRRRRL